MAVTVAPLMIALTLLFVTLTAVVPAIRWSFVTSPRSRTLSAVTCAPPSMKAPAVPPVLRIPRSLAISMTVSPSAKLNVNDESITTSIASSPLTSTSPPAMTVPPVMWAVVPGVVRVVLTAV